MLNIMLDKLRYRITIIYNGKHCLKDFERMWRKTSNRIYNKILNNI